MSGKNSVKNSIRTLIDGVNDVTGSQATDLTGVINSLIDGYGQGESAVLQEKIIDANGTYIPDDGYDGFSLVTVNTSGSDLPVAEEGVF